MVPLQGCFKGWHSLSIQFVRVASLPVRCSNTGLKMRNKKCESRIHPFNGIRSYSPASHLNCLFSIEVKELDVHLNIMVGTRVEAQLVLEQMFNVTHYISFCDSRTETAAYPAARELFFK